MTPEQRQFVLHWHKQAQCYQWVLDFNGPINFAVGHPEAVTTGILSQSPTFSARNQTSSGFHPELDRLEGRVNESGPFPKSSPPRTYRGFFRMMNIERISHFHAAGNS